MASSSVGSQAEKLGHPAAVKSGKAGAPPMSYHAYACQLSAAVVPWYCPFIASLSVICAARGIMLGAHGDSIIQLGSAVMYAFLPGEVSKRYPDKLGRAWLVCNIYRAFVMICYGLKLVKCWSACLLYAIGGLMALFVVEIVLFGVSQQADLTTTLMARAVNALGYAPFWMSKSIERPYLAVFAMFFISAALAIAVDLVRQKNYKKSFGGSYNPLPSALPEAPLSKVLVKSASASTISSLPGSESDDEPHEFDGLDDLMLPFTEADSDTPIIRSVLSGVELANLQQEVLNIQHDSVADAELAHFSAPSGYSITSTAYAPSDSTTLHYTPTTPPYAPSDSIGNVQVYVPWSDPEELKNGQMDKLKKSLAACYPGLEVLRYSVHRGSLLLILEVLFTGSPPAEKSQMASQVVDSVSTKLWLEWLELPWPKDGKPVTIQVGRKVVALKWDEDLSTWVEAPLTDSNIPTDLPAVAIFKMSPPTFVMPDAGDLLKIRNDTKEKLQHEHQDCDEYLQHEEHDEQLHLCTQASPPASPPASPADNCTKATQQWHQSQQAPLAPTSSGTQGHEIKFGADALEAITDGSKFSVTARHQGAFIPVSFHLEDCPDRSTQSCEHISMESNSSASFLQERFDSAESLIVRESRVIKPKGNKISVEGNKTNKISVKKGFSALLSFSPGCDHSVSLTSTTMVLEASITLPCSLSSLEDCPPSLSAIEVWHGKQLVQSHPFLVLPKRLTELALELDHALTTVNEEQEKCEQLKSSSVTAPVPAPAPGLHMQLNSSSCTPQHLNTKFLGLLARLGGFLEYCSGAAFKGRGESFSWGHREFQEYEVLCKHMVCTGRSLLEHCILSGWVHCACEVLHGLTHTLDCTFEQLAHSSNPSKHTLLHVAVLSGKSAMVAQVI
eukprot:gene14189-20158_t